jgi:hypothetical protein
MRIISIDVGLKLGLKSEGKKGKPNKIKTYEHRHDLNGQKFN